MGYLPSFSFETWILLITFICLFVVYGRWTFGTFKKLGIPGPKPLMYFGTIGRNNIVYYLDDVICSQKYGKVWGMFELRKPALFVMDPDMLKTILVKECFTYFTNRRNFRLIGDLKDSLSFSEDDQWRRIRNGITPLFSSGRIKEMFTIMKHHSHKLKTCLESPVQNDEVITMKDFFGGYSMDVMLSCSFSVDMDIINNRTSGIISHAMNLFKLSKLLFIFSGMFPIFLPLLEWLDFSFFSRTSTKYLSTIVEKMKAGRIGNSHQDSKDLLQRLLNSQTTSEPKDGNKNKGLTDAELISQMTTFLFAGYDTSGTTLVFLAYMLAQNPEVMNRLQEEIDSTFPNKGQVEYEALMQMEYLDSVVNETLRLYPPAARLERVAKETVKIKGITIPKGMLIEVPVYALHRHPEIWPEPEEFRPDRFSKKNMQSINPYTYLPFGIGPRNCLGLRFALAMVKLALVEVLQNYSFRVCEETEIPLTMSPDGLVGPLNPIKLKMVQR